MAKRQEIQQLAAILLLGCAGLVSAVSTATISFSVTYDPATLACRTCTDSVGAVHATGECLQLTAGCPTSSGENNAGACIGGFCGTDDDAGIGGDLVIQPPPPTPGPTRSPSKLPTRAPATRAPTAAFETFSPTSSSVNPTRAPATRPPTRSPAPPPPPLCSVTDSCSCADVRLAPAQNRSVIDVTCLGGGFVAGVGTGDQTLDNVTLGACSLSYNETFNYTDVNGDLQEVDIKICYGFGQLVLPPSTEECKNNTGVIIIIVICVLLLLAVIAIGIYYIVHTTKAHSDGPKFAAGSPHTM